MRGARGRGGDRPPLRARGLAAVDLVPRLEGAPEAGALLAAARDGRRARVRPRGRRGALGARRRGGSPADVRARSGGPARPRRYADPAQPGASVRGAGSIPPGTSRIVEATNLPPETRTRARQEVRRAASRPPRPRAPAQAGEDTQARAGDDLSPPRSTSSPATTASRAGRGSSGTSRPSRSRASSATSQSADPAGLAAVLAADPGAASEPVDGLVPAPLPAPAIDRDRRGRPGVRAPAARGRGRPERVHPRASRTAGTGTSTPFEAPSTATTWR